MQDKIEIVLSARNMASRAINGVADSVKGITRSLFDFKTMVAGIVTGYGMQKMADSFIKTAASMDQMKLSLDTITKGKGEEWFQKLNDWALKMPVNTEKAIQSFSMMRAMGLQPTIDQMTVLVDTTSALGGQSDTLEGLARALGQIQTKGKVSAEELMQLAERGVPAYEILREKLGLSASQVANIGNESIDAGKAIDALFTGMAERFGGMSGKMQDRWSGLIESVRSYYKEFQRLVMESGPMKAMEKGLGEIVKKLDEAKRTGQLDVWAMNVANGVLEAIQMMMTGFAALADTIYAIRGTFGAIVEKYYSFKIDNLMKEKAKLTGVMNPDKFNSFIALPNETEQKFLRQLDEANRKRLAEIDQQIRQYEVLRGAGNEMAEDNWRGIDRVNKALEQAKKRLGELVKTTRDVRKSEWPSESRFLPSRPGAGGGGEQLSPDMKKLLEKANKEFQEGMANSTAMEESMNAGVIGAMIERMKHQAGQLPEDLKKAVEEEQRRFQEALVTPTALEESLMGGVAEATITRMNQLREQTEKSNRYMIELSQRTAEAMEKNFSDLFFDMITGKFRDFGDYVKGVLDSIARATSDMLGQMMKTGLFGADGTGGLISGLFSRSATASVAASMSARHALALVKHAGGIVGQGTEAYRMMPTLAFAGAPRLHMGLAPDEFPAILQRGEQVLSRQQVREQTGRQPVNVRVNVVNNTGQQTEVHQEPLRWNGQEWVISVVLDAIDRNVYGMRDALLGGR